VTRQRARYLRRAIPRHRRCPKCPRGVLTTDQCDVSTLDDYTRGVVRTVPGWTRCNHCDHRQTEPVS
jgi:hypothetical protein